MHRRLLVVAILAVLLLVAVYRLSPLWPGPALPAGATRLHITTEAPHLVPDLGCPAALLGPIRIEATMDELVAISLDLVAPVRVVWPSGWAAWDLGGRAELVDRNGTVVAREGDIIHDRFGGGEGADGAFRVCSIGS